MAFTLEDGTGIANANAYVATATVDTYWSDRGNESWDGSAAEKQAAVIAATDYIEREWGGMWKGNIASTTQGLSWPRDLAYDNEGVLQSGVPARVLNATAELALRALSADLSPDLARGGAIKKEKKGGAGFFQETEYSSSASPGLSYPNVYNMVRGLLVGSASTVQAIRV